jgi:hypothetical protein
MHHHIPGFACVDEIPLDGWQCLGCVVSTKGTLEIRKLDDRNMPCSENVPDAAGVDP